MDPDHETLLAELRAAARPTHLREPQNDSYGGSDRPFYDVPVPERRAIARRWLAARKGIDPAAFLAVVDALFDGQSHEEKTLAAIILALAPKLRRAARPEDVDRWLGRLNGWAEVDSLCQNLFTASEMLSDWPAWRDLVTALAGDTNINKRRAALVLLTGPVYYSDDGRLRTVALTTIDRLADERDILITKAVSWLLRSMIKRHRDAVETRLAKDPVVLPAIAVRETRNKLSTGLKSGRGGAGADGPTRA